MNQKLLTGCVVAGLIAALIYGLFAGLFASGWTADTLVGAGVLGAAAAAVTLAVSAVIARRKRAELGATPDRR